MRFRRSLSNPLSSILAVAILTSLLASVVHARLIQPWNLERLATKVPVLIVGEVVSIDVAAKLETKDTRWNLPLLRKKATIRILRSSGDPNFNPDDRITLEYLSIDSDRPAMMSNGPTFPHLEKGRFYVIPLRKEGERWVLPDDEDHGMILPAAAKAFPAQEMTAEQIDAAIKQLASEEFEKRDAAHKRLIAAGARVLKPLREAEKAAKDAELTVRANGIIAALAGVDAQRRFLYAEIAAAMAHGDIGAQHRLAHGFSISEKAEDVAAISVLLDDALGRDADQWLRIALTLYAGMYSEKKIPLFEFAADPPTKECLRARLLQHALTYVGRNGLDEKITRAAFKPGVPYADAVKLLVHNGLAERLQTQELLIEALQATRADAVAFAYQIQRGRAKTDAVAIAAVSAALKVLSTQTEIEHDHFHMACQVILLWGEERDLDALYKQFEEAKTNDDAKRLRIWTAINWSQSPGVLRFAVSMLDDTRLRSWGDMRNCDSAVYSIQNFSGEQFLKLEPKQPLEDRDLAVKKAREWIEKQSKEKSK